MCLKHGPARPLLTVLYCLTDLSAIMAAVVSALLTANKLNNLWKNLSPACELLLCTRETCKHGWRVHSCALFFHTSLTSRLHCRHICAGFASESVTLCFIGHFCKSWNKSAVLDRSVWKGFVVGCLVWGSELAPNTCCPPMSITKISTFCTCFPVFGHTFSIFRQLFTCHKPSL